VSDGERPTTIGEELLRRTSGRRFDFAEMVIVPLLAVLFALVIGGLIMLLTGVHLPTIGAAYAALFSGSVGSLYALSETLTAAAPLILAGLGVALAFRAGLFNIGGEGQLLLGGMAAVIVGFSFNDLPPIIHVTLALAAGALAGAVWAAIAGWLKAATGAHEVITTIMLNFVAMLLTNYLLRNPPVQRVGRTDPISKTILQGAQLPPLLSWIDPSLRLHAGIFLAIAAVGFVYWLLYRTTVGFEFRAAGLNPEAARYAGMRSGVIVVTVMAISGALCGLAGANQVLGVLERATPNFSSGIGFDAIAVALLGRSHPIGVAFAGLLFGALDAGGRQMQADAGVSLDLISVVQALVIIFIAAPLLMRQVVPWAFPRRVRAVRPQ
jgi:ABC-type uncharacterized transport system permease subunit